jgi:hypothetical protein
MAQQDSTPVTPKAGTLKAGQFIGRTFSEDGRPGYRLLLSPQSGMTWDGSPVKARELFPDEVDRFERQEVRLSLHVLSFSKFSVLHYGRII